MDLKMRGRSAVITGASKGIGRAVAERLAGEGGNVHLVARTATTVGTAASELKERKDSSIILLKKRKKKLMMMTL